MEPKDYYRILGVEENADPEEIKAAYRKLALQYHPDRNRGNAEAADKMRAINESYAVISDPEKRSEYDEMRKRFGSSAYGRFRQSYSEQDIFRGSDIDQIFEEMGKAFGFRNFEEVFRESYGPGYRRFEFRRPGVAGRGYVIYGRSPRRGERTLPDFPLGGNLGKAAKYMLKRVWGLEWPEKGKDLHDSLFLDSSLARSGGEVVYFHGGRGKELKIKIPSGMKEGRTIRLAGMGEQGKGAAGSGDLYLEVRIKRPLLEKIKAYLKRIGF
jgi:DnaJ-class molecular chaperone